MWLCVEVTSAFEQLESYPCGRLQVLCCHCACGGGRVRDASVRGGVSRDVVQNVLFLSPAVPLSPGVFLSLSVL